METNELEVKVYRLDDIPLIFSAIEKMNIISIIDKHLRTHGLQHGLSNGKLLAIWICHILTTSNHAKVHVRQWCNNNKALLESLIGQSIREAEFDDSKLSTLLLHLSNNEAKTKIEKDLFGSSVYLYDIKSIELLKDETPPATLPCEHIDTTTACGYHMDQNGVMRFGHSKDYRPDLLQLKLLAVSLNGNILHHQVYPGNQADDGLYYPAIENVREITGKKGLLYVGDSKMSALETRSKIARSGDFYLTPLPQTKGNKEFINSCIEQMLTGSIPTAELVYKSEELIGGGYAMQRTQNYQFADIHENFQWNENVFVFRSLAHLASINNALQERIKKAINQIKDLTPAKGRGKRQITTQTDLEQQISTICQENQVENLLDIQWAHQVSITTKYVGKGRGTPNRPKQTVQNERYQILSVTVNQHNVKERLSGSGWKVYVSNVPKPVINLSNAISTYRKNYQLENSFHILKSSPLSISPLFVRKDEQINGLTNLLMLAVRVIDYIETTINEQIKKQNMPLKGIYTGLPNKLFFSVTFLNLLKYFSKNQITLTTVLVNNQIIKNQTDNFNDEHIKILKLLDIPIERYTKLAKL